MRKFLWSTLDDALLVFGVYFMAIPEAEWWQKALGFSCLVGFSSLVRKD